MARAEVRAEARKRERSIDRNALEEYALTSGELGAAAAQTVMVVLLPVLLRDEAPSAFLIGFAVGGEGLFTVLVPLVAGVSSDRLPAGLAARFGRRALFLMIAAPVMAAAISLTPFVQGYWLSVAVAFVFFAALHVFMTPLWALMVDAVPDDRRARVQGVRGAFRAAGLAYGLVASGLLFSIWPPLPFLLAGALVLVGTAGTVAASRRLRTDQASPAPADARSLGDTVRQTVSELRANGPARWLLAANALWNGAIDGIRPYIFLFATAVVGVGAALTSVGLIFLVVGIGIGSLVAGRLGDRLDRARLLAWGTALLAVSMGAGFFIRGVALAVVLLFLAGLGAATIIALPYPLYAHLMDERNAGEYTGLFVVSVGTGRIVAPMLVGAAIDLGTHWMPEQHGYPFMWLVAAVLAAAGWCALYRSARLSGAAPGGALQRS